MAKKEKGPLGLPSGWTLDQIQEATSLVIRQIDAYNSDPLKVRRFDRYNFAQDIFDDNQVPSNLSIIEDVDPKNYPLLRTQVKGATRMVVSAFNGADPYYIFKGGDDTDAREAREKDTQLALETDNYKAKLREIARLAAIKARGPYRIVWEERKKGQGWITPGIEVTQVQDGEYEFVGPRRETIAPEDFGIYPLSEFTINDTRSVWHRWSAPMYEIWEQQERGEWFSREMADSQPMHEQPNVAEEPEDYAPNIYTGIFRLPPGMDRSKPLQAYRMILLHGQQLCLYMEPYDLPMPEYFAPGFEYDPLQFWPTHSLASSVIEMQAELNDVQFIRLMGAVASAIRTVLASGFVGESTTTALTLGKIMQFRGDPKFMVVDTTNPPSGDLGNLAEQAREYAEAVSGFSQVAAGQLPEASQTATATGGALQGTADEGEEKRQNFLEEEIRAVQFVQILIRRNFKAFKMFHKKRLMTTKASDWDEQYTIGPNGQGPNNNPQATIDKLGQLVEILTKLGIPWLEDLEMGAAQDIGIAISKKELVKALEQNFDFPMSMEKIVVDTSKLNISGVNGQPPPVDFGAGPSGPFGPEAGLPVGGDPTAVGGIPPELLAMLAGAGLPGQVPMDPSMAGMPPPPQFGPPGLDPNILLALSGAGGLPA